MIDKEREKRRQVGELVSETERWIEQGTDEWRWRYREKEIKAGKR